MPYLQTIQLSKKYKSEGVIKLYFNNKADVSLAGYFSTTLYYRSKEPFTDTDYYHGINIYAQFINTEPYFDDVGYIIYTDKSSYPILAKHFGDRPKVILAVVDWPRFSIHTKMIDGTILRALRYQAQDHFTDAWIAVRDADTLFAYEINNCLLKKGPRGTIVERPNAAELLRELVPMIASWERTFLRQWLNAGDAIVISTNDRYRAEWHKHMPFTYAPKPLPYIEEPVLNNKDKLNEKEYEAMLNVHHQSHIKKLLIYRDPDQPLYAIMKSQLGVYAGFTNIGVNAPKDIWSLCCKYLSMFYSIIVNSEHTKNRIISNTYSSIGSIGKDERMILFVLMPAYLDQMYFVNMDYYGGLDIGDAIFSPNRPSTPALDFSRIRTSNTTAIAPVQTLLLAPNYANFLYTLPYVYISDNPDRHELVEDGTMNEHFKEIFSNMIKEYEKFMSTIGKVGTIYLKAFGSAIKHGSKVIVPALENVVYKPIEPIRGRVVLKGRRAESASPSSANRASTRRIAKLKSLTKKTLRQSKSRSAAASAAAAASVSASGSASAPGSAKNLTDEERS